MLKVLFYLILCYTTGLSLFSQNDSNQTYLLKGVVINGYSNEVLIGAHLVVDHSYGTKTNGLGEFSISVNGNDSLLISFIGFKTLLFVVPHQNKGNYLTQFKLYKDSISLEGVEIFPYPTYTEFQEAFLEMDKQDEQIKMVGVRMYQDRIIHETYNLPLAAILTNPVSLIYNRLFDKKAKLNRKLDRRRNVIQKKSIIH